MSASTSPSTTAAAGCAAPDQAAPLPASVDLEKETVISGVVCDAAGQAVAGAYVRLLDASGEFTAEVPTSATGHFRFFAGDGEWTLRTLAPKADPVDTRVVAATGSVAEVAVAI